MFCSMEIIGKKRKPAGVGSAPILEFVDVSAPKAKKVKKTQREPLSTVAVIAQERRVVRVRRNVSVLDIAMEDVSVEVQGEVEGNVALAGKKRRADEEDVRNKRARRSPVLRKRSAAFPAPAAKRMRKTGSPVRATRSPARAGRHTENKNRRRNRARARSDVAKALRAARDAADAADAKRAGARALEQLEEISRVYQEHVEREARNVRKAEMQAEAEERAFAAERAYQARASVAAEEAVYAAMSTQEEEVEEVIIAADEQEKEGATPVPSAECVMLPDGRVAVKIVHLSGHVQGMIIPALV